MIGFTVLAFSVLLWHNADLSVDITSRYDAESQKIVISIQNTAASSLLFYENADVSGKIEYLSEEGWVEYCDVCYTTDNINAFSQNYGGTFAELRPGENWKISIPEDKMEGMQNGTYRVKLTYITEEKFNRYLELEYKKYRSELESESSDVTSGITSNESSDITSDVTDDETSNTSDVSTEASAEVSDASKIPEVSDVSDLSEVTDAFLAESLSDVFIKTFEYIAPEKTADTVITDGTIVFE